MQHNKLSPEEENILINKGTEAPFTGEYCSNKAKGIYSCKQCNAHLYTSESKFDSGCGWPAFSQESDAAKIKRIEDISRGMKRVEVRCSDCDSHLGHVFAESKGERYCINSVCLKFEEWGKDD